MQANELPATRVERGLQILFAGRRMSAVLHRFCRKSGLAGAVLVLVGFVLGGCKTTNPTTWSPALSGPLLQAFLVNGGVREVRAADNTVVIQHEAIPGYMEAMTMPFTVKNARDLDGLQPGDKVSFRLIVTPSDGWVEQIEVLERAPLLAEAVASPPQNVLPATALVRVIRDVDPLNVGDLLPDYTFTNEVGQAVSLNQFRGQVLALNFIFTRCPFPKFCPLMARNFAEVQEKLKSRPDALTNWHLFTLSFDPEFDTPAVLQSFAKAYHADPSRWTFLTGSLLDVTALTEQFGMQFWREKPGDLPNHNLRTVVVDAQGHVYKIIPENKWTSYELIAAMLEAATTNRN